MLEILEKSNFWHFRSSKGPILHAYKHNYLPVYNNNKQAVSTNGINRL